MKLKGERKILEELRNDKQPIVPECAGCSRVEEDSGTCPTCSTFAYPATKWRLGNCYMQDHIVEEKKKRKYINPIKASKRMRRRAG